MSSKYKTYSVRIPKGPLSDYIDACGNGTFLRSLVLRTFGTQKNTDTALSAQCRSINFEALASELCRDDMADICASDFVKGLTRNSRIVILCEGETEVRYFREYVKKARGSRCVTVKKANCTSPHAIVKEAKELISKDALKDRQILEVWAVFDRDSHVMFADAFREISGCPNIKIAWSNPCFEFWLILHYRKKWEDFIRNKEVFNSRTKTTELLYDQEECYKKLKLLLPQYKKNKPGMFEVFRCKTPEAIQRASMNHTDPNELGSSVGMLIKRIAQILILQDSFFVQSPIPVSMPAKEALQPRASKKKAAAASSSPTEDKKKLPEPGVMGDFLSWAAASLSATPQPGFTFNLAENPLCRQSDGTERAAFL